MSYIYNFCEGLRMEVASLPAVQSALGLADKADAQRVPGSDTSAGQAIGEAVRALAKLLRSLPGGTLLLDTATRSYALDLLESDLKKDPNNPWLLIQTAEAEVRVAHLNQLLRLARVVEPVSMATGEILRAAAAMGNV